MNRAIRELHKVISILNNHLCVDKSRVDSSMRSYYAGMEFSRNVVNMVIDDLEREIGYELDAMEREE